MLETVLTYMETLVCIHWFYPMPTWTVAWVLLIAVHAWAAQDPCLGPSDVQGFHDVIPHVTPHDWSPEPDDMLTIVPGLAGLVKQSFPFVC